MRIALRIIVSLLSLLISNQVLSALPQKNAPLEKVSLQLKWFHLFQFAGYYAAKQQGYYADEGLEVEIFERNPDKDPVRQVLSGEVDFAVGDSGIVSYFARGEPIVALAAVLQHNPLVFVAKQSSGIISPYEMRGKRIMFDSVGAGDAPLRAILAEANLDEKDYTAITHSFNNDDLITGKVDVMSAYLSDQLFYFKEKNFPINVINPQSYGIDFYSDILFTSQNELAKHPERAKQFRRASLKGWQYALDHPEEIIQLIHNQYHSKASLAHLRFEVEVMRKLILPDLIPLGQIESRRLQKVSEVYAHLKISRMLSENELAKFIYADNSLNLTAQERVWLKAHPVIRLGIDRKFAPYEWIDKNGDYQGIASDYIALLEKSLGVKFFIVKDKTWAQILDMARAGQLDMIACAVETPERTHFLSFSKPFIRNPVIIINDSRKGFIGSLDSLNGKSVAIEKGYFMQESLTRDYPKIQLVLVNSVEEALISVANGKADAYIGDAASATHAIQESGLLNLTFSGQTPYSSSHSMAIVKSNPELAQMVAKFLDSISTAEQERIKHHWLSQPVSESIKPATLIKFGLVALLILIAFFVRNVYLRKEVARRKVIEQQLRNLLVAVEQSPASVVITDLEASLQYVNPKFTEVTGYTMDEAIGKNPRILHSGLTPAGVYQQLWDDLTHGKVWHGELINQRKNGEHYWEEAHLAPVKNSAGVITNYVGVKIDITARKRMEQQLSDSAAFTTSILNSLTAHIAVLDREGTILAVNNAWMEFAKDNGKPRHKVCEVGDNYLKVCQESFNYSQFKEAMTVQYGIMTVLEGLRDSFELEYPCHFPTEQRWFVMRVTPFKDRQQGVVVSHENITHLKKTELVIAESKALLRKIIDTVPMRIFWKDCNLNYLGCNRAFALDAGRSHPDDLIGKDDYQMGWRDQAELYRSYDRAVIESDVPILSYDEPQTTPDGQTIWLRTSKVPLKNHNNQAIGVLGVYEDITERKLMEIALKASEARARAIIDASPIPMTLNDKHGNITFLNPVFIQTFGYDLSDIPTLNDWWPKAYPDPQYRQWVMETWQTALKTAERERKAFQALELIICCKNGAEKTILVNAAAISQTFKDEHLVVLYDITERKQAEQRLKESDECLNLSQEYGGIGSWEADLINKRQVWSRAVYESLGFPKIANPTWDDFLAIIHPEDKEMVIAASRAHLTQGKKYDVEYRVILADGQQHWMRSVGQAQFATDGTPVKFRGIVQDISERKQNELELDLSNTRFIAMIEAIPDAIFFKGGDSRWLITNETAKQLFLLHDISWQGKTEMELAQMRPEFRAAHEACLIDDEKTWEAGRLMIFTETIVDEYGSKRYFEVRKMPIFDEYHQRQALVIIGRDITERIEAEQALLQAKEVAIAANQAKSDFLANMSHEIRTPMNAILGFSGILSDLITDEKQLHYLNAIKKSGKSLLQLINDILDLSKIEARKFELHLSNLSLKSVFDDITMIFSQPLAEKNIAFHLEISENIPACLLLDEIRLRQVLLNLIGNAVKFTDAGFIRVNVSTQPTNIAQYINLSISIADSGMGIAQDQRDAIFDAFTQQKKQSLRYGGTGLGLTISKRLTEMMGGSLQVESKVGQGSCFTLSLPQVEICYQTEKTSEPKQIAFEPEPLIAINADTEKRVQVEKLPELVALLKADYQKIIVQQNNSGALQIDALVDIAEQLLQMGTQYQCELLSEWAGTLKMQAELFDLAALPKTLSGFENLLEQLT